MKIIVLTLSISLFTFSFLNAQDLAMQLVEKNMSQGIHQAIEVDINDVSLEIANRQWEKFIKQYKGKTKYNKSTFEYFTDNAKISEISSNSVDLYATIVEYQEDNKVTATFWIDLGGSFINSKDNPERIETVKNLINVYVKQTSIAMAEEEFAAEEKILKRLHNDMSDLQKDKSKYESKIADAEKLIKEMNESLLSNSELQKAKLAEVEKQQSAVDRAQDKLARIKS